MRMFLIVDDCVSILRLIKWKLQVAFGNDTDVQFAMDGEEAINTYCSLLKNGKSETVDAIVMDHHMPKCSGMDAIKYIRLQEAESGAVSPVNIIGFSADISDEMIAAMLSAGANFVLPKPPEADELENLCRKILVSRK